MPSKPPRAPRSANDAPVLDETTITDLPVSGTLPVALSGQYLRIGPNRIDARALPAEGAARRAMVHAVSLRAGRAVSYRNRWVGTDATNLIPFGSSILALGDGALAYELSAGLDTLRRVDLAGARRTLSSQPKVDPITGELHLLTFAADPSQLHVCVSPGGLTRAIRSMDNAPSRIRQLELTRDDVVLLADGFVGVTGRSGVAAEATWLEIDTDARHVATADAHGEAILVCATGPSLVRWVVHRRARTVHCEVLDATPQASPSSNPPPGAARRFLWTVGAGAAHKHELPAGTRRSHDFSPGRHPGALVFIADPDRSSAEDGGWLVGFVHDETRNEADLVVLDAQAIERPAVATVHIPRRIPDGMHGTWIPAVQI